MRLTSVSGPEEAGGVPLEAVDVGRTSLQVRQHCQAVGGQVRAVPLPERRGEVHVAPLDVEVVLIGAHRNQVVGEADDADHPQVDDRPLGNHARPAPAEGLRLRRGERRHAVGGPHGEPRPFGQLLVDGRLVRGPFIGHATVHEDRGAEAAQRTAVDPHHGQPPLGGIGHHDRRRAERGLDVRQVVEQLPLPSHRRVGALLRSGHRGVGQPLLGEERGKGPVAAAGAGDGRQYGSPGDPDEEHERQRGRLPPAELGPSPEPDGGHRRGLSSTGPPSGEGGTRWATLVVASPGGHPDPRLRGIRWRSSSAGTVDEGDQLPRCQHAVALRDELPHLLPVGVVVEDHADRVAAPSEHEERMATRHEDLALLIR